MHDGSNQLISVSTQDLLREYKSDVEKFRRLKPKSGWGAVYKLNQCFHCGSKGAKADSHNEPESALRRIAKNNKVLTFNELSISFPHEEIFSEKLISKANVFYGLCNNCEKSEKFEDILLKFDNPRLEIEANNKLALEFYEGIYSRAAAKIIFDCSKQLLLFEGMKKIAPRPSLDVKIQSLQETIARVGFEYTKAMLSRGSLRLGVIEYDFLPFTSLRLLTPRTTFDYKIQNINTYPLVSFTFSDKSREKSFWILAAEKDSFGEHFIDSISSQKSEDPIVARLIYETLRLGPAAQAWGPEVAPLLHDDKIRKLLLGKRNVFSNPKLQKKHEKEDIKRLMEYWIPALRSIA